MVFDLHGKVKIDGEQRNIIIERNPKQEDVMRKLESAFEVVNSLGVKDLNGRRYNFKHL